MNAPSHKSIIIAAGGFVSVLGLWVALAMLDPDSALFLALSDLGEAVLIALSAVLVIRTGLAMDPGWLRTRWLVIGAGVALYAVGDAIWSYIELVQRAEVPYPGVPDLFYIAEYLLLSGAILGAGIAYRQIVDIRRPAIVAGGMTIVSAAALWFSFIAPLATAADSSLAERVFNVFYPMADIVLLGGPALFTIMVVAGLGTGKLGRPWWAVALGVLILAISDTTFSWMMATDSYRPGTFVDVGWMLAHVAIGFGALIALDLAAPVPVRADVAAQAV